MAKDIVLAKCLGIVNVTVEAVGPDYVSIRVRQVGGRRRTLTIRTLGVTRAGGA
jgi:hypothetical protein